MVGTIWNAKSLRSCGTSRQLRSNATILALALDNAVANRGAWDEQFEQRRSAGTAEPEKWPSTLARHSGDHWQGRNYGSQYRGVSAPKEGRWHR